MLPLLSAVGLLGYYGAYAIIRYAQCKARFTLGFVNISAASFMRSRDHSTNAVRRGRALLTGLYLQDLFDFFETTPTISSKPELRQFRDHYAKDLSFEM